MLIPLKVDVPMLRRPWVNYLLIFLICDISILAFFDSGLFQDMAGLRGDGIGAYSLDRSGFLPYYAVSSSLVHGGWLHLIGNMCFLWVFGNAVNYKFGQLQYLGLYLFAALVGGMAHYWLTGLPVVGASGAINGVMGAFLVFFPRNDVTVWWLFWGGGSTFTLSSFWIILFWVVWDTVFLFIGASGGVALWCHIGGFMAGFGVAIACAATGLIKPTDDEQTLLQLIRGN